MHSTHSTLATCPRALVITFQSGQTRDWAICWSGRAGNVDVMATWPIVSLNQLLALLGARFATFFLATMTAWEGVFTRRCTCHPFSAFPAVYGFNMTAKWQTLLHQSCAIRFTLLAAELRTQVIAALDGSMARLSTAVLLMFNVIWMA